MGQRQKGRKPSLRTLVIGATAGAFVVMFLFLYLVFSLSMEKFLVERESDNIMGQATLAESALQSSVGLVPNATRDWSSWDLTWDYVHGDYDAFLDDYLTEYPFQLFHFNLITILDADSDVVFEQFYDYNAGEYMKDFPDLTGLYERLSPATMATFQPDDDLTLVDSTEIGLSGFVEYEGQVYYLSSYPILRSNETGPSAGSLIFGRIISCEALMRWRLPGESISPIEFIPLAEESGLIIPLSWWMLSECCRMGKVFADHGIPCHIAINMSAQVLLHDDLLPVLRSTVARTGIDLSRIDIEIIESTLVADVEKINLILNELHALGAEISVDDFGTGYSSLSYLNKMAVDRIKIDRSFISKLNESEEERELVTTIINMGKNLHMVVTAEGVEDDSQFRFLQNAGCDEIQGYLISPALPGDVFIDFVEEWNRKISDGGEGPVFPA